MYDCLTAQQQQQQKYNPNRELYKTFLKISVMHWIKYEISIKYITKDVRFIFFPPVLGESDLLFRNVPVRTHEADQPGGSRGRGSRRLFPRIPRHAGRVALSQGRRKIYIYLYIYIFHWTIFTHALTHTHTRDVYSFRPETGCVLTRVAAGIMFSAPTARRIHNRSALLCTSGGESLNMLNAVCVSQEAH